MHPCNHRTVEVGRNLWRSSHPASLPLKQVAQAHVQAFEYLWGWRLHNHPRHPVTALNHQQIQKVFPDVKGNLLCLGLYPLPSVLSLGTTEYCLALSPLHPHAGYLYTLMRSPQRLLVSRLNSPQRSQTEEMLQSLHKLSSPLVNSFQCACICFVLGSPKLDLVFQVWASLCWVEGKDSLLWPTATTPNVAGETDSLLCLWYQRPAPSSLSCLHS